MENIKIQITLPIETLDILEKDAATFGFIKNDKLKINISGFMNRIFRNYLISYRENHETIKKDITQLFHDALTISSKEQKKVLETLEDNINKLIDKMVLYTEIKHLYGVIRKKETVRKEFCIQKENVGLYQACETLSSQYSSLSGFFRNLFISYSSLSFDQRELIIFRSTADTLLQAIQSKKRVKIITGENSSIVSPIALMPIDADSFNYLICDRRILHLSSNYRLSTIDYVEILNEKNEISQKDARLIIENAKKHCSQRGSKTLIKIHFTESGEKKLYQSYFLQSRIVHVIPQSRKYTFSLSETECLFFLIGFEEEAIIIEPIPLAITIQERLSEMRVRKKEEYQFIKNVWPDYYSYFWYMERKKQRARENLLKCIDESQIKPDKTIEKK